MLPPLPFQLFANPRAGTPPQDVLPEAGFRRAEATVTAWEAYAPTPLRDLPDLARRAGLRTVRIKDEAGRFGLGSFKALGGAYAVAELVRARPGRRGPADVTVACATDGNHGRAVAWGAARAGCRCVIFLPDRVSPARAEAIARHGAELRRVPGTYDDAVRQAERIACAEGWLVVSDTAWPGYVEVPRMIMQGYRLMTDEALRQWRGPAPTHVFVQAGVGGAAASVSAHLRARLPEPPALVVVEPEHAACLLASAELGTPTRVAGELATAMAGLACGEPSLLAWQELEHAAWAFMSVPDAVVAPCMRALAERGVVAGESAVAGLAAMLLAAADPAARATLGLGGDSRVLLFSTEGATDPDAYARLVGRDPEDVEAHRAAPDSA